jgi:hypothetical protein
MKLPARIKKAEIIIIPSPPANIPHGASKSDKKSVLRHLERESVRRATVRPFTEIIEQLLLK